MNKLADDPPPEAVGASFPEIPIPRVPGAMVIGRGLLRPVLFLLAGGVGAGLLASINYLVFTHPAVPFLARASMFMCAVVVGLLALAFAAAAAADLYRRFVLRMTVWIWELHVGTFALMALWWLVAAAVAALGVFVMYLGLSKLPWTETAGPLSDVEAAGHALGLFFPHALWVFGAIFCGLVIAFQSVGLVIEGNRERLRTKYAALCEDIPGHRGSDGEPVTRLAHISDLHVTSTDDTRTTEKDASPNSNCRSLLQSLSTRSDGFAAVLLSGDITDSGSAAEWANFFGMLQGDCSCLRDKLIMVPGNHDLNIHNPRAVLSQEGSDLGRRIRLVRSIAAVNAIQGRRAVVVRDWNASSLEFVPLEEYLAPHWRHLNRYASPETLPRRQFRTEYSRGFVNTETFPPKRVSGRSIRVETTSPDERAAIGAPFAIFDALFPMIVSLPGSSIDVVVLNSVPPAYTMAENAFGNLGSTAIARIKRLKEELASRRLVYALHHQVVLPRSKMSLVSRLKAQVMTLEDGGAFLDALRSMSDPSATVVLHGHQHINYRVQVDPKVQIAAAPSSTLGDELETEVPKVNFTAYDLASTESGVAIRSWSRHS